MYINNQRGDALFVEHLAAEHTRGNVIFCCTPVVPVTEFRACYQPLVEAGFDVYALDFAGIGHSGGDLRHFSVAGICDDFDSLAAYIRQQSDKPLFLFGDTGTGGIIAQYYAQQTATLSGFAQFGNAIYQDAAPLGMSKTTLALAYPLVCLLAKIRPNLKLKFSAPKYEGYHADIDNQFYADALQRYPYFFDMHIQLVKTLLEMLCAKDSALQDEMRVPTLLFKTTHDRYFPATYFDRYYHNLNCPKKLVEIDDVHNSYYFYPAFFAGHVAAWFSHLI